MRKSRRQKASKRFRLASLFLLCFVGAGCTEVVSVDVDDATGRRLIVEQFNGGATSDFVYDVLVYDGHKRIAYLAWLTSVDVVPTAKWIGESVVEVEFNRAGRCAVRSSPSGVAGGIEARLVGACASVEELR